MLEILNRTKRKLSAREIFLFKSAYKSALPKGYELSLVICTDKITDHNVLAYPLSKTEGEIFINPSRAGQFTLIELFIHACVHLLGGKHGKTMEKKEEVIHKKIKSGS